jgi:hypothetical protein
MRFALLATALVTLTWTALWPRAAHATSCAMPTPTFGDQYSDVVFEATAAGDAQQDVAKLTVSKVYKGEVPATVEVRYGGMKGYAAFDKGKRYLVFGIINSAGLFAHLCGATHPLPAPKMFREGPWLGWSVEKQYGVGKAPGSALVAAPKPSASAAPDASAAAPQPTPATTEPLATSEPEPQVDVVPTTEPASGGCAGCTATGAANARLAPLWLVLALLALRRRG